MKGSDPMAEDNLVTLLDEDGNEVQFEFLDLEQYQEKEYVILLPAGDTDGEVVILQVEEPDDENEAYIGVDDPDVLEAVFARFKAKFSDEFDFV
jgi:uncharacterized protein YrzB (UPF0473 family)